MSEKDCIKLAKFGRRGYVSMVEVDILTRYFSMPKVEDIRMVYNRTYSGLRSSLWEPHFALPKVGSTLQAVERGTLMADRDIGEMLLNFMLSE